MTPKSEEFKSALSTVREQIAIAKRRGIHRGFIDYHGCISVTRDFIEILEDAGQAAERGEYSFAYSVAALVLVNLAKLASTADDSAGGITDARSYVDDILEKVCSEVPYYSNEAEYIFLQSLKDSKNKAFEGWDEFAYSLLLPTARLATFENAYKLYAVLDEFNAKLSQAKYSSWHLESDSLVRLAATTAVDGEQAAERFIDENLNYDGIRRLAIRQAMAKGEFARAEKLCRDKLNTVDRDYYWTKEWYDALFDVYLKTDDRQNQANLAEDLLVNKRDTKYYPVLKQLLKGKGVWDSEYPSLLERLDRSLPYHLYMKILSQEGEISRLLGAIRNYPAMVFDYGTQLSAAFSAETYALCLDEIRKQAGEANNRIQYKKVCSSIKKLFEYGGIVEMDGIVAELKIKYPRRPALIEELNALTVKMAKKRK